jgi:cation-transporting ATPase E
VGTVTIGVPATVLALESNTELVRGGFLARVSRFAVPAGLVAGMVTFLTYVFARQNEDLALIEQRTTAVLVLAGVTILVLVRVVWPLNPLRVGLVAGMIGLLALVIVVPTGRDFFDLALPQGGELAMAAVAVVVSVPLLLAGWAIAERIRPDSLPAAS